MNKFEKKAIEIIRKIDMYDKIKQMEIIAEALEQEYKNAKDRR